MSRSITLGVCFTLSQLIGCGGTPDEGDCNQLMVVTYPDADLDGFGDDAAAEETCGTPAGRTLSPGDCDDSEPTTNAGAIESCDDVDNDCDGEIDEGLSVLEWYPDGDGDGYGVPGSTVRTCAQPEGFSEFDTDCDDTLVTVSPGSNEVCDGLDNDCDGDIDNDDISLDLTTQTLFFEDSDGDGFGNPRVFAEWCADGAPASLVQNDTDCDDTDRDVNPGANEVCSGVDDDCDNLVDENDPSLNPVLLTLYYEDLDGDGFGNANNVVQLCVVDATSTDNGDDCDDNNPLLGLPSDWYIDTDQDGFGSGVPIEFGTCVPFNSSLVPDGGGLDCNDNAPAVNPGATEICGDSVDSNCDGKDCDDFVEDFESGFGSQWRMSGAQDWGFYSSDPYEGAVAAKSGSINDNQLSSMQITLYYAEPGDLAFWHSGSTENGWDFLYVYIDGIEVMSRSGTWSWTQYTRPMGTGLHTVKFEYDKDPSVSAGDDAVYIDLVQAFGGEAQQ